MSRLWFRVLGPIGLGSVVVAGALRAAGADALQGAAATASASARSAPSANTSARVAEPLARAQDAERRAKSARQGGDPAQAALLEALAGEWNETAQTLAVAQKAEDKATQVERQVGDLEARISRARTLLEETAARRGRARAALQALTESADAGAPAADGGHR